MTSLILPTFSTRYSSLTHFSRLPVDLIKVDQSFVCGMLENPDDLPIVEDIISWVKAVGCKVMAEGLETVAHRVALLQLGCDLAQRFAIGRSVPAEDILKWYANCKSNDSWHDWQVAEPNKVDNWKLQAIYLT
jgi:EAL domain-containing protein (putative c-di-GMP-specific phosphodiesterase class I)